MREGKGEGGGSGERGKVKLEKRISTRQMKKKKKKKCTKNLPRSRVVSKRDHKCSRRSDDITRSCNTRGSHDCT